jgi:nucleoside-diphosphate-sugar epimerase
MHALVTGGGGFLGRYVVEQLLDRGDRVRVFSRGAYPELEAVGAEVVRGDLQEGGAVADACHSMDAVFHVAGKVGIWGHWRDFYKINVIGTQNVIDGCRRGGVKSLILTSSPSVTFNGRDQTGVDESVPYPTDWLADYPHSKALAEQLVLAASEPALQTCALRPHLVWGPRDQHLTARLIARARSGRLRRVGEGDNLVDMVYVENAASAHLQAADALQSADSAVAGKAYFISQGEPVQCWQWIDEILALVEQGPVKHSLSRSGAQRLGAVCEWVYRKLGIQSEPPMTRFLACQLATAHWFNISAARRDFGYDPAISTEAGMQRLGAWLNGPGRSNT